MTDRTALARRLGAIALGLLVLAWADVVVLERILKPLAARGVPWSDFEVALPGGGRCLVWHLAFAPLGLGLFAALGLAAGEPRTGAAGAALFATGWEDAAYYLLLRAPIPASLPWLDPQPGVAWTRFVLRSESVTRGGLVLAMVAGAALAAALLRRPASDAPVAAEDRSP